MHCQHLLDFNFWSLSGSASKSLCSARCHLCFCKRPMLNYYIHHQWQQASRKNVNWVDQRILNWVGLWQVRGVSSLCSFAQGHSPQHLHPCNWISQLTSLFQRDFLLDYFKINPINLFCLTGFLFSITCQPRWASDKANWCHSWLWWSQCCCRGVLGCPKGRLMQQAPVTVGRSIGGKVVSFLAHPSSLLSSMLLNRAILGTRSVAGQGSNIRGAVTLPQPPGRFEPVTDLCCWCYCVI